MLKDLLHIFTPDTHTLKNGKQIKEKFNSTPYVVIGLIVLALICATITNVNFPKFFSRFDKGWSFVLRMRNP